MNIDSKEQIYGKLCVELFKNFSVNLNCSVHKQSSGAMSKEMYTQLNTQIYETLEQQLNDGINWGFHWHTLYWIST